MKKIYTLFRIVLLMACMSSLMFGDSISKEETTEDIMSLVAKVKKADASERRVLMNELKISLRQVNQTSRQQVMLQLRKSFTKSGRIHSRTRTHSHQSQEGKNISMSMHHNKGKKQKQQPKRGQ